MWRNRLIDLPEKERLEKVKTLKHIDLDAETAEYLRSKGYGKLICDGDSVGKQYVHLYPEEIAELGLEHLVKD